MTMTLKYGTFPDIVNSPNTVQAASMDATGERWASIFQIATAGNIAKIHAYAAAVTGADTVKISLQTVDMATGLPSGTIWATATGNKAYGTVSVTGAGWQTVTFTEVAAVAVGDYAAIVIEAIEALFYLLVLMATTAYGACPEGFVLEQNELGSNCRNPACDAGANLSDMGMTHDMAGMPLPQTGGWTIGAYQCPPDPLGIHPNPAWPCGFDYCPGAPRNVRIANVRP